MRKALALVAAALTIGTSVWLVARSGTPGAGAGDRVGQREAEERAFEKAQGRLRLQSPPDGSTSQADGPIYDSRNTDGEAGSGGRAIAYRSGGRAVAGGPAADGRLFRTGYGSWEPSIGLTRDGTIYVAARNSNADPGVGRSADGGRTWERSNPSAHAASLDPFIWVDRTTGRVFTTDITPNITCPPFSFTDDGGKTYSTSTVCGHTDYQKVFGGPPPAGGEPTQDYPNVVYFCAITGGVGAGAPDYNACSKSLDGGGSFTSTGDPSYPPRLAPAGAPAPYCDGGAPPGVVDSKGTVYLPRGWCGEPYIAISKDEGATWERVKVSDKLLPYDTVNGAWANDSGVAVDRDGVLYYVWSADDGHPYLSISRNGGTEWSAPRDLLPPGVVRTQNPAIDVGDPGKIAISFIGTRDARETPAAETSYDGYVAQSTDALADDPTFVAGSVNDPEANTLWKGDCSPIRCGNMGDFYDIGIGPDGVAHAAFVDSCPNGDQCTSFGVTEARGEGVVGQLSGGPTLVSQPAGGGQGGPRACVADRAIASASVAGSGRRGLRVSFRRASERPVTVDVFQQSIGRRVTGERLLARFADRRRSFTWNGRANRRGRRVRDGILMVRLRARGANGGKLDTRRLVVRRRAGRFTRRPGHYGRDLCRLVERFKLERPVFGGTTRRPLGIAYRLTRNARVTVTVKRRGRVVRRYRTATRAANRTYRLRLPARGTRRGDHRITIRATSGSTRQARTLTSRRL